MTLVDSLGPTRSSYKWSEMPGNWDKLNTRALYASSNDWGIPDLPHQNLVPGKLISYNDRWGLATPRDDGAAVHFFLDDYRFETVWTKPERPLSRLQRAGTALTPDFSLWTQMPRVMQIWQVYRARWCGAWMHQHHIQVIPTVGWSGKASFNFCFAGIPIHSTVAISGLGVRQNDTIHFDRGLDEMLHSLLPQTVLVYGTKMESRLTKLFRGVDFRFYPTRWGN